MTTVAPQPGRTITLVCGHEFATWGRSPQPGETLWCRRCDAPSEAQAGTRRCASCGKPMALDSRPNRKNCSPRCRIRVVMRRRRAEAAAATEADRTGDIPVKPEPELDGFTRSIVEAMRLGRP